IEPDDDCPRLSRQLGRLERLDREKHLVHVTVEVDALRRGVEHLSIYLSIRPLRRPPRCCQLALPGTPAAAVGAAPGAPRERVPPAPRIRPYAGRGPRARRPRDPAASARQCGVADRSDHGGAPPADLTPGC